MNINSTTCSIPEDPEREPFARNPGKGIPIFSGGLRLALFEVLSEEADYLVCKGYNPDTRKSLEQVHVAKPYLLQKKPFDGKTVQLRDMSVSYEYQSQVGLRIARATVDGDEVEETQRITEDYIAGDVIIAVRARIECEDFTGWTDENGDPIEWVDLNFSGRAWAVTKRGAGQ
jgi:hypothetical protein